MSAPALQLLLALGERVHLKRLAQMGERSVGRFKTADVFHFANARWIERQPECP
jgi:hypothetical protein